MSNYNNLKTTIDANIKQNGNQEITGPILNSVLNQMVNILGTGYQFAGIATLDPATEPGTPDAKVFYIANGKGTYTNFGGIEVTEDDVVVLYWDSAWHKVATGIASQEKLSELRGLIDEKADEADLATVAKTGKYADLVEKPTTLFGYGITDAYTKTKIDELLNTKQNELTLTVKDNGNIVIGDIQGQSKEFMPATPSGDPMHYAYEAAGAVWNDTGADIVKTAPWADLADDDTDKTVVHKPGYWYINGLGDLSNADMRKVYTYGIITNHNMQNRLANQGIKTCISKIYNYYTTTSFNAFAYASSLIVISLSTNNQIDSLLRAFYNCNKLKYIGGIRCQYADKSTTNAFYNNTALMFLRLSGLAQSISLSDSKLLTNHSILFLINNEASTSAITITLHADAYARAMADADILAALEAHPNISLASA